MKTFSFFIPIVVVFFHFSHAFAINPDREYIRTPDSVDWKYEQLKIITKDDFTLNSWIYEADKDNNKDTVLILAYPDAGNMSYFVYHAMILANAGYTVVTFDYRGFGKSQDFEIQREYLYYNEFAWDLEAVVETMSKRFHDKKIGVWGMSMGTTVVSRAFPKIKSRVDFIVGEGYVTNPVAIVARYQKLDKQIILPESPRLYDKAVRSIDVPLLILTASNDQVTSHQDATNLQSKLGENCQIIQYSGDHLTGFQVDYENKGFGGWYVAQINKFLEKTE